ncbi:5'/3'-nucleotidase SurE [Chelatococcus asaccharovorans]|uniref:5'-nucleotidase n=1 Tax=Chelatococcus asaccharovorans TaxID=28210 RepID=A0A2V3TWW6_9HYPH|nr:5'/3'-nucleotidase SurE [Chelatococcus asaccharovorans]MBS7705082.1 5'/3'-nucleotidase SurE [Chelatococcus asaccharovorans]PXW53573.1 5'-nucleotidase [Chelatococcus asaccharovorans]
MRILISNDDGIDALGLAELESAARLLSDDVWIVAPDSNRSGFAHGITLRKGFDITKLAPGRYVCSGTPADCVIGAMSWVFRDATLPDMVLSGINEGRNVAEDVSYSGTMAVAREAALRGIPGIALSRPRDGQRLDVAGNRWLAERIEAFWQSRAEWARDGHWLSVNLPRQVPAHMRMARIGRDKVANRVIIHRETEDHAVIEPLADRSYASTPGDENHLIDSGIASVICFNWMGQAEVPSSTLKEMAAEPA